MGQGTGLANVVTHMRESFEDRGRLRCVHFLSRIRLADGGIARAVLDICGGLAERGHDVAILTADEAADVPAPWTLSHSYSPRLVTIPMPRLFGRVAVEAVKCLAGADVLHLHGPWDVPSLPLAAPR